MKLFGTDGMRGVPNRFPLDGETVVRLGRGIAQVLCKRGGSGCVCLARDTRHSGTFLSSAVSTGLLSEGVDVLDLGVLPTPGCAALLLKYGGEAGIVISASHNPATDNGIKIFDRGGRKLSPEVEGQLEDLVTALKPSKAPSACGKLAPALDSVADYLACLKENTPELSLDGMDIVVDCSNGAQGRTAPKLLSGLGASLTVINNAPDGSNINRECGSEHLESAIEEVKRRKADLGVVFDGDGDRVLFIDERGVVVDGDHVLAFLALDFNARDMLPGPAVVCTDYSNMGLDIALSASGIQVVRAGVGDREVGFTMQKRGHVLGGEQSGHVIFSNLATTGDGLLTALQVLELLKRSGRPLSAHASVMTALPQVLLNLEVPGKVPVSELPRTREVISGIEKALGNRGRVYVRYSGTQNVLRVMVEGEDKKRITEMAETVAETARNEVKAAMPKG